MDPVLVECPADEWTLVAEYMLIGAVHVIDTRAQYYYTYRETGEAAPTEDDAREAVAFRGTLRFPDLRGIDVYVYCKDRPGTVRVDNPQQQMSFTDDALDVHDSCVHDEAFLHFIAEESAVSATLTAPAAKNTYQLTVASAVGWAIDDYLDLYFGVVHTHIYRRVTAIDGNVLTLNTRLDRDYPAGSEVNKADFSFNVVGTMANPRVFSVPLTGNGAVHVTAIHFSFLHKDPADDEKFAGIPELANGLVLRINYNDGEAYRTIFNWRNNREIKLDVGNKQVTYAEAAPSGANGTSVAFDLKQITESILRISGPDNITVEMLVQDDLTGGTDMYDAQAKLLGHFEGVSI